MENILGAFTKKSETKKAKDIKAHVRKLFIDNGLSLFDENLEPLTEDTFNNIDKQVEVLLRADIKKGDDSVLTYKKGEYKQRPSVAPPPPPQQTDKQYIGAAGETSVMSELLFREYNANRMIVDKGIDIVASKDNVFRYIQVKTSNVSDNNTINWSIKKERFNVHVINNLRYILVARYQENFKYIKDKNRANIGRNMYFILKSDDIDRGIAQGWIYEGPDNINIKVKFCNNGDVKFYNDGKEEDASYYLNRFENV